MDTNVVRQGYNKAAHRYLAARDKFKNKKYIDALTSLMASGETVLDIGCGAGVPIDSYLVEKGCNVIGLDISEKQIELAKEYVPQGKFLVKDMSELRGKEFSVNAVVSFYAIFHTSRDKHEHLFKVINSFLPKGGLLLVSMGSSDWEGTEDDFHGVPMAWSHYDAKKNKKIVQQAGFRILSAEIDTTGGEKHLIILAKKT